MRPLTNFTEANQYLRRFYDYSRTIYTLDNMLALMKYLGNPQEQFKSVHVAGTSGKTSTAYYMAALLTESGKKVGLTVSPHVLELNERVQINGIPVPEKEFCQALTEFAELIEKAPVQPSWFEAMVAFAYWYFAQQKVDYAVVEVGLGGLKDGTNVIKRPDKVCVLTDIGQDHTKVLGNSLTEIAWQKVGIVHEGNAAFTYWQSDEIMAVYDDWIKKHQAELYVVDEDKLVSSSMPDYQHRNWQLAHEVYEFVRQRDGLPELTEEQLDDTKHIQVPGRMDVRNIGGKTVVMDGAHNAQKMSAFVKSFQKLYPDTKPAILIGLKEGKEYEELVPLLKPLASRVITTSFQTSQDLPLHSMDPEVLAKAFNANSIPDHEKALQALLEGPEKVCVITGSLYLLSQLRLDLT